MSVRNLGFISGADMQDRRDEYVLDLDETIQDGYVIVSRKSVAPNSDEDLLRFCENQQPEVIASGRRKAQIACQVRVIAALLRDSQTDTITHELKLHSANVGHRSISDQIALDLQGVINELQGDSSDPDAPERFRFIQSRLNGCILLLRQERKLLADASARLAHIDHEIVEEETSIHFLLDLLGHGVDETVSSSDQSRSPERPQTGDADAILSAPPCVRYCLDQLQKANLAKERLIDHEATYEEDNECMDVNCDSGCTILSRKAGLNDEFERKKQVLQAEYEAAAEGAAQARVLCSAQGYDLESYRWRPRSRSLSTTSSRPSSADSEALSYSWPRIEAANIAPIKPARF